MLLQGNDGNFDSAESRMPHKVPKRVLHFCDGTLEEYSTDDESLDGEETQAEVTDVDPGTMTWGPWIYYQTATAGTKTLAACDYLGESLASFFGIISPKYQYEIDEFNRISAEDKEMEKQQDVEMGGWTGSRTHTITPTLSLQPTNITV